jgi:hypothetical protein
MSTNGPKPRQKRWEKTIACLKRLNELGIASRMDVYKIFGNEANLNSWLARLITKWHAVKEINRDGERLYTKTRLGHTLEDILLNHQETLGPLREILQRYQPIFPVMRMADSLESQLRNKR